MICARLRYASRGLFVGAPPKLSRQLAPLLALQRLRRHRQHLRHLREHCGFEVQLRGVVAHRLQRLVQPLHRESCGTAAGCLGPKCVAMRCWAR